MPKKNRNTYTKVQRLKFYQKKQRQADFKDGIEHSAIRRMEQARQMIAYENEARDRGVPISKVIAEHILSDS